MGTSGNRKGYKVFSINTTVRNPKRNTEFLEVLDLFDGLELTNEVKDEIYTEIVRRGIYKFTKFDSIIREKYEQGIELTDAEIKRIILDNPQKTGDAGRLMTQIRAIKDCGFLTLEGNVRTPEMKITPLGRQLLEGYDVENVYTKAMLGLHYNNPQRTQIYNEARPFLNTLFVIYEINKKYNSSKGILWHEFAFFVLPMLDCNYKSSVNKIVEYRSKYKNKINKGYLESYIYDELGVEKLKFDTIIKDYTDDVYRKFDMTGLFSKSGFRENTYLRFNQHNITKILSIIELYKNYEFKKFNSTQEYIKYLSSITLPWEESDEVKLAIIKDQSRALNVEVDSSDSLDEQMDKLNKLYIKSIFDSSLSKFKIKDLIEELLILDGTSNKKSLYSEVPDPVRLEWLIGVLTAKTYGSQYVKPNLSLDSKGIPKSHAAGGMADIEFVTDSLYCLIEVTLIKDYKQQTNSETTSISDHLSSLNTDKKKCSLLLAPYIHRRVVDYFQYCLERENISILALTIQMYINIVLNNKTLDAFENKIDYLTLKLKQMTKDEYTDLVNKYKLQLN